MNDQLTENQQQLIEALRSVSLRLEKSYVSSREFYRESGISEWKVLRHFNSFNELAIAAGLETQVRGVSIDENNLLEAMYRAFIEEEGIVSLSRFERICEFSAKPYRRRWGSWESALVYFKKWVESSHPDFPYVSQLPNSTPANNLPQVPTEVSSKGGTYWPTKGGRLYGPILNFRGLQHAPINEQGVVFLFGVVAFELGYVVESVTVGFPDCEAKRRIDSRGRKWERVRIEFEYRSRNFIDHGHDPTQCELIVCWEHDWPDCPLEVLELQTAIQSLDPS